MRRPAVGLGNLLRGLTAREGQVVGGVALGKSNKMIAHELGIAHSTARVLLTRAYGRLGVRSRKELLRLLGRRPTAF